MTTAHEIIRTVAEEAGVQVEGLLCRSRCHIVAWPRQLAYLLIQRQCGMSLQQIAREMHRKDHTTILHGFRAARRRLLVDPSYRALHDRVVARLRVAREKELVPLPSSPYGGENG